jgi:BASS family bile acid:Na+ symporter
MVASELVGSIILFVLMLVVGLELTVADFRRALSARAAIATGTLAQLIALPLMTWLVVFAMEVPPVFGAGAVLVAVSPGAGISNILAALANANVALSVTLTAMTSVLAVISLPAIAAVAMQVFLGDAIEVEVPVVSLIGQLAVTLLLPIALGMWVRTRFPGFALRHGRTLQRIAMAVIIAVIAVAIAFSEESQFPSFAEARVALLASAVWTVLAMAIGWGCASVLGLSLADRVTFTIEFSARNVAVASIVAISGLGRLDLTYFSGTYVTVGYLFVGSFAIWARRRLAQPASD